MTWFYAIIFAPGVAVHEIAHRVFCDLFGVPVYDVCYYQKGDPAGFVLHGRTYHLSIELLIAIGPLIINSIACSIISYGALLNLYFGCNDIQSIPYYLLLWLSISIGLSALPSKQDMKQVAKKLDKLESSPAMYLLAQAFIKIILGLHKRASWGGCIIYILFLLSILPICMGFRF